MRAVVLTAGSGGEPALEVRDDVERRWPLGPAQVRVRIVRAGLCHSDVSVIDRTIPFPLPVVLGHEGAGVVEEVGDQVAHVAPGDHVVLTTLTSCGVCRRCAEGRPVLCKASNRMARPFTVGGEKAYDFASTSVWAEESVVDAVQAVKIPPDVPFEVACLVGCGVLTGTGAVFHRAKVAPGDSVAVIGVGGIGLSVVQAARIAGATRIVAVDTNPAKEDLARRLGATHFVDPAGGELAAMVADATGGPFDHVVECVGHPELIRAAVSLLDWGGQVVILGVPRFGSEASFVVNDLYHDKSILGCRYGSSRPQRDIPVLVDLYRKGDLLLDDLVTATYPLEDVHHALDELEAGRLARGVLAVGDPPH